MDSEMDLWDSLTDAQRAVSMRFGAQLISWSGRVASYVMRGPGPRIDRERRCLVSTIEEANGVVVGRFDKEIKRALTRMRDDEGIRRPLLPLCVAVWKSAMAIPFEGEGSLGEAENLSAALMMTRIRSTAEAGWWLLQNTGDVVAREIFRQRGLM